MDTVQVVMLCLSFFGFTFEQQEEEETCGSSLSTVHGADTEGVG